MVPRKLYYEKEVFFYGKGSSMMRRTFDYEKEGVLWRRKFCDEKKV